MSVPLRAKGLPLKTRSGTGLVLLLVLFALFLSSFLLISRLAVFQTEVRHTGRDRDRELALEVARSALAEARAALIEDAARPGTPAFAAFRSAAAGPIAVATPQAATIAPGAVVGPVTRATVVLRRPLDLTEYEVAGLVRLEAHVMYGPKPGRTLTVSMDHEFKVVNLAPPRPFGKMAVSVAGAHQLVGADPNARILLSARALANLAALARTALEKLSDRRGVAASLEAELRKLADELAKMAPAADGELPPGGVAWFGDAQARGHELQLFVPGAPSLRGHPAPRAAAGVDLLRLHLPSRLAPGLAKLTASEGRFDAASEAFHKAVRGTNLLALVDASRLEEPARGFAAAAGELASGHRAVLDEIARYQREVSVVSGADAQAWTRSYWPRLAEECWERRAFYEADAGVGLDRLPALDGVFRLAAPAQLAGPVEGRRVLVTRGPVRLDGLARAAGPAGMNLTTLIVHGDLELAGEVDASVLVMPAADRRRATVRLAAGTRIRGVLALGPGVEVAELAGRVDADPLVDSGGFGTPLLEDRYRVALSPEPLAQGVFES